MIYSGFVEHVGFKDTGMIYKFKKQNHQFIFTFCAGEFLYKLGFTPDMVMGKTLYDLYPDDVADRLHQNYEKAWQGQYVESQGIMNDFHYVTYLRPLFQEGKVVEVVATSMDITERIKMQRAIIQAKEEAEKANMAKSDFLAKMSHELRTPLNGILGFAQLLEMDQTITELQQEFVQEILASGRHLVNLINDILDLSRIEIGKLKVEFEQVTIYPIVKECIQSVQPLARKKNVQIYEDLRGFKNTTVLADQIRLKQILLNLLDNAIKYNETGGKITITGQLDNNQFFIHIADTGKGFSPEEYEKVFLPFYRVAGTKEEGAGIGLSLAKHLVEVMNGVMGVNSKLGEGTDFWFSLPFQDVSGQIPQSSQEKKGLPDSKASNSSVLYIEDNKSNLKLVKNALNIYPSYKLFTATNGVEGIQMLRGHSIDLVLLDMNLPDINGDILYKIMQTEERTKGIPMVALSANAMQQDIQKALDMGFKKYLTKPIDVKELLLTLNELLGRG